MPRIRSPPDQQVMRMRLQDRPPPGGLRAGGQGWTNQDRQLRHVGGIDLDCGDAVHLRRRGREPSRRSSRKLSARAMA